MPFANVHVPTRLTHRYEGTHWSTCRYLPGTVQGTYTVRNLFGVAQGHRGQGFDDQPLLYAHTNLRVERGMLHWRESASDATYGPEDESADAVHSSSLEVGSVFWSITGATPAERVEFARVSAWNWHFNATLLDGAPLDFVDGHGDRKQRRGLYRALRQPDAVIGALHYPAAGRICIPAGRWFGIVVTTSETLTLSAPLYVRFTLHTVTRRTLVVA